MKTIIVTGGNRGIGRKIVEGLASSGEDKILLGCRNLDQGRQIAQEIGPNVLAVKLDLSTRDELNKDIEAILSEHGEIYGLVNNAGIITRNDFLGESLEELDQVLRVNTMAPYELIKKLLPSMIEKNEGKIVNVSSGYGSFKEGLLGPFSYSLSKAALNAITFCGAKELPSKVKINAICPGWVASDMGGPEAPRTTEKGAETAVWLMGLGEDSPSGKFFRDKEEIAW